MQLPVQRYGLKTQLLELSEQEIPDQWQVTDNLVQEEGRGEKHSDLHLDYSLFLTILRSKILKFIQKQKKKRNFMFKS